MLPGVNGHLLSAQFLEQHLAGQIATLSPADRRAFHQWRRSCAPLGPAASLRSMLEVGASPLARALGFDHVGDAVFSTDLAAATLTGVSPPVALIVSPWGDRLDPYWRRAIVESQARSATWCLLFNGTHLRLLEARRVFSRRYLEFDIDLALDDGLSAAALWTTLSATSLSEGEAKDSALHRLLLASDRHAAGVSRSLKDGVLSASAHVLGALLTSSQPRAVRDGFDQGLTIVYRLLFLLFAEARGLAPMWHPVYRESYSVAAMRDAAEQRHTAIGLWDALRAVSRMAHAGCRAGSLRVTAFNGRLFAPSRTPLVDRRNLDDEAARAAILALSTRQAPDRGGRERIAYRDLGVEQLGNVYETLLDYEPHVTPSHRTGRQRKAAAQVSLRTGADLRKTTGSFYTPQSIADYLTRRTLAPLVAGQDSDRILALRVLDPAMGSGAFLVSACSFLAHAYETALVSTGACHAADLGPVDRAGIRRTIAERCLYGVDANPMAVQLARLSLWLATLSADKPLSFLDHHLQTGDSLIGAWLSSLRSAPGGHRLSREASLPLFDEAVAGDALREAVPVRFGLALLPDDTAERVRMKERALAGLNDRETSLSRWKRVADHWCAHWFLGGPARRTAFRDLADFILTGRSSLPARTARAQVEASDRVSADRHFFHWELEFPEVFFDANGARLHCAGFDAVLGNPPWDMIRADTKTDAARSQTRRDNGDTLRFTRDSGVYTAQSAGHANRYQLFVERAVALARRGGRVGLVLPSGLAIDQGSAGLRRLLFSRCAVDSIVAFDNRRRVFPIHRSVRFLLVTATPGAPTTTIGCRLGESDPSVLDAAGDESTPDSWFTVRLTTALLTRISGDGLAIPDLRSPLDVTIAERAAALYPALADPSGWNVRFGRELNATDDRDVFVGPGRGLPVLEGKDLSPFRVSLESARLGIPAATARQRLGTRHDRPRLAYRDVASATNRQTLIAALLPAGTVSTHTVFCLRTPMPIRAQHFLCGVFNSFVVNYLVRLRVATHVTTAIVERLPIPGREDAPGVFEEIAAMARLLARRSASSASAADARARLDAHVARLYQLSPAEFAHVLDTFPLVPREARDAAMAAFER